MFQTQVDGDPGDIEETDNEKYTEPTENTTNEEAETAPVETETETAAEEEAKGGI